MIKGCKLVWCMFLLMTCFFPIIVSMYGHVNFSSVWTCLCAYVRTSLVWLAAVSFRCPSSSCSLIKAGAPCAAERKHCIRKCLPDIVLWPQCQSDIFSSEEKEKHHSNPETFPNPVAVEFCLEREVWSFLCLFWALWLTACWWMWQKYIPVTIHDSTPMHKFSLLRNVLFSNKSNWSCIWTAQWVTKPSLRHWVMMSYLGNYHWDSRKENNSRSMKTWEKTEIGGDGCNVFLGVLAESVQCGLLVGMVLF